MKLHIIQIPTLIITYHTSGDVTVYFFFFGGGATQAVTYNIFILVLRVCITLHS